MRTATCFLAALLTLAPGAAVASGASTTIIVRPTSAHDEIPARVHRASTPTTDLLIRIAVWRVFGVWPKVIR